MFEWLAREGGIILSWWALVTIAGAAALPLCLRLLGGLPDRGYTLARAAGVLPVAFVYWLLASLGFLRNTTGGMVLAWAIVLVVALTAFLSGPKIDLRAWWRENRRVVFSAELLFIVLFLGWAIVRAHQNWILYTEKDMELAFISGTMRSETYPPNDPWMAGYAISYYYFGYVITAMLSMLSGISSTIGFNMIAALTFGLAGLTAFGVVYNLVRSGAFANMRGMVQRAVPDDRPRSPSRSAAMLTGIVGVVFVLLMSNFQLLLIEYPYQTGIASREYLQIFDSNARLEPNVDPKSDISEWDYWWWFRGARVLNDRNLDGSREEVIDEFPLFSFLLADNHPHVLALPYAILALGLALNTLLTWRKPNVGEIVFYSVALGGLIFLNTWDGPIYIAAIVGADGLRRLMRNGSGRLSMRDLGQLAILALSLLALSVLFYLPFLINFRSQAGGILPNLVHPTLFSQFFVMWGPFLLLLTPFLLVEAWRGGKRTNWRLGFQIAFFLLWLLLIAALLLAVIGWRIPDIRDTALSYISANGGWSVVLPTLLGKRITHGLTTVVLLILLGLVVGRLFPRIFRQSEASENDDPDRHIVSYSPATGFTLLLVGLGLLLTLAPEFVYLRDNFGTRMNTVFKFYYQAWIIWSIAGAYGVYSILAGVRIAPPVVRVAYAALALLVLAAGLLNPILGIYHRVFVETGRVRGEELPVTLDGGASFVRAGLISQSDYDATLCIGQLVQGDDVVVVEAYGQSYGWGKGKTGTLTGIPILYNWPGHQGQWRGATLGEVAGSRQGDIDLLYSDPTWDTTQQIIDRYGIDYIFFGTAERNEYGPEAEIKFRDRLEMVCEFGNSRYYRVGDMLMVVG